VGLAKAHKLSAAVAVEGDGSSDAPSGALLDERMKERSIGMTGFEPAASSSRTKRATKLRYIPMLHHHKQKPPPA
jgi:hypothetical protein